MSRDHLVDNSVKSLDKVNQIQLSDNFYSPPHYSATILFVDLVFQVQFWDPNAKLRTTRASLSVTKQNKE